MADWCLAESECATQQAACAHWTREASAVLLPLEVSALLADMLSDTDVQALAAHIANHAAA